MTQCGTLGIGSGEFNSPVGVAVDNSGNVYVSDTGYDRIQKFRDNYIPTFGTLTPSVITSAPDVNQNFSSVYSDANGYSDLAYAYLQVGSAVNEIYAYYNRPSNRLYLRNDADTGTVGYCTPGQATVLMNTQGTLNCATTTVTPSGNDRLQEYFQKAGNQIRKT